MKMLKSKLNLRAIVSALLVIAGAQAEATERVGKLLSKDDNCGVIDVSDGFLANSGGSYVLVLKTSMANLAFEKELYIVHSNGQSAKVVIDNQWWQYSAAIKFESQADGRDFATIMDQMVSSNREYIVNLYLKMNGIEYACTNIRIGQ